MEAVVRKKSGEKSLNDLRNKYEKLHELLKNQFMEQEKMREELDQVKAKMESKIEVANPQLHLKDGCTPPNEGSDGNLEDKLCQHQDVLRQLGIQMVTLDTKVLQLQQQLPKINSE